MSNPNKIKKYLLIFIILNIFFSYTTAFAQATQVYDYRKAGVSEQIEEFLCAPSKAPENKGNTETAAFYNTGSGDLYRCINRLYRFAIIFASVVAVMFIVIAGYLYMSAEGNQEAVDKAKAILTSCVASLVILFAGYILLRAINPELIEFKSIQPPSIVLPTAPTPSTYSIPNNTVIALEGSGCVFQTDKQKNEAPQMAPQLVNIVKNICYNIVKQNSGNNYPGTQGHPPTISSVIGQGQHAENSYHYIGCAVDFADGGGNGFFDFNTKQGRPTGVAIYQEALKNGISIDRIDPGTDRTVTNMLHIDLGNNCPNK
jgi:hypothetical protein